MYVYPWRVDGLHCPIQRAFRATEADATSLSYGNREDLTVIALTDLQLIDPRDTRSEHKVPWLTRIDEKLDEGWRLAYTDGWGQEGHTAYACHRDFRREGTGQHTTGGYLRQGATVADSERKGVAVALESDKDMLLILTNSMAVKSSALNLARGAPSRSGVEQVIISSLCRIQALGLYTGISWISAHIRIAGNEIADRRASFESQRGHIAGEMGITMEGGIRQTAKATRADARSVATYGKGRFVA